MASDLACAVMDETAYEEDDSLAERIADWARTELVWYAGSFTIHLLGLSLLLLFVMLPMLFMRTRGWYAVAWPEYECGVKLASLAAPADYVICHGEDGPQTLYVSGRQGWWVRRGEWGDGIARVKELRAQGGRWFASTYLADLRSDPLLTAWLEATFPKAAEDPRYLIYDLRTEKPSKKP